LQEGEENDQFNYKFSGTRILVEYSVGRIFTTTKAVHTVKATTVLHNAITDLEALTELELHIFIGARADPRAYIPPRKRNNPSSRTAVSVRKQFCWVFQAPPFATYTIQLKRSTAHTSVFCHL
jgi:hypothetical protein